MSKEYRVAIVGATGLVGETMLQVLEERKFPVSELHLLASNRSLGKRLEFKGRSYPVKELASFDFKNADIGLFSPWCRGLARVRAAGRRGRLYRHR
jgi:aspartate-semialdehyde dehydrogenase